MAKIYPKFDQKINEQISTSHMQKSKTRVGTVANYDRIKNTAVIILESNYSNTVGNIIKDVPCPTIYGLQSVAPEPGDRCVIGFRDENERLPHVITFLSDTYNGRTTNSSIANNGIPRFLI